MHRTLVFLAGLLVTGTLLSSCASTQSGGLDSSGYSAPEKVSTVDATDRLLSTHKDLRY